MNDVSAANDEDAPCIGPVVHDSETNEMAVRTHRFMAVPPQLMACVMAKQSRSPHAFWNNVYQPLVQTNQVDRYAMILLDWGRVLACCTYAAGDTNTLEAQAPLPPLADEALLGTAQGIITRDHLPRLSTQPSTHANRARR